MSDWKGKDVTGNWNVKYRCEYFRKYRRGTCLCPYLQGVISYQPCLRLRVSTYLAIQNGNSWRVSNTGYIVGVFEEMELAYILYTLLQYERIYFTIIHCVSW